MRQPPLRVPRSSGTWGSVSSTRTKRYWGTQRVARVCQVSPATVANWIDQGLLKGHKTPTGRRRVESDDLAAFLRAHGMGVPPDLERSAGREVVVVVEDDAGYRRALVLTIAKSDLAVEGVEAATGMDGLLERGRVPPSVTPLAYTLPGLHAPAVIRPRRQ